MQDAPVEPVVAALRAADGPATARTVAGSLGVHVSTARYHLDRLVAAGRAMRSQVGPPQGRGRPELAYTLVDADAARAELIRVLVSLAEDGTGSRGAIAAGERWAAALGHQGPDAVVAIERQLASRGFAPEPTPAGLDLHACPFRDAARAAPHIVCALHLGLTRGIAAKADDAVDVALEPFVTDTLCRILVTTTRDAA